MKSLARMVFLDMHGRRPPNSIAVPSAVARSKSRRTVRAGTRARANAETNSRAHEVIVQLRPRLTEALIARYGPEVGTEAAGDAIVWALSNPEQTLDANNPIGLLYRVGQSKARPGLRWVRRRADALTDDWLRSPEVQPIDPTLVRALATLTLDQRTAVLLVHAFGWSVRQVAELRDLPTSAITNHLHRGLAKLRTLVPEDFR